MKLDRRAKVLNLSATCAYQYRLYVGGGFDLRVIISLVDKLIEAELLPQDAKPSIVWNQINPPGLTIMLHSEVWPQAGDGIRLPDVIDDDVLDRERWWKVILESLASLQGLL